MPEGEDPFAALEGGGSDVFLPSVLAKDAAERAERLRFTTERAIYLSVILHLLFVLFFVLKPPSVEKPKALADTPDPLGLIKLLSAPPAPEPIPVQFFPAPGRAAPKPGPKPLPSDVNRVAHGGSPELPKAERPRSVAKAGIQDLAEGPKSAAPEPSQAPPASEKAQAAPSRAPLSGLPKLSGLPSSALAQLTPQQAAAAARAASSSAGGDGGAGFEQEGGFVDSGPLSFDTAGYDWGNYAAEMIRRIKRNWEVPGLAFYGIKGRVTIRFFILKDGRVEGETILSSAGIPPYDNAAFQAIAHASPFKPLPADLGHDREGVTVTFLYNVRPEDVPQTPKGK